MEPIERTNSKLFLILGIIFLILVVVGFFVTVRNTARNTTRAPDTPPPLQYEVDTSLSPEDQAKINILANLASTTKRDTPEEQAAKLQILANPPKKIVPADTTMTDEEKLRILESLSGKAQ